MDLDFSVEKSLIFGTVIQCFISGRLHNVDFKFSTL